MPLTPDTLLRGVLAPAVIAGLILLAGWRLWRAAETDGRWSGSLALGLAFFAAYWLLLDFPPLPFGERTLAAQDWLAWMAGVGGLLLALGPRLGPLKLLPWLLVAGGMFTGVTSAMVRHHWEGSQARNWQLGLGAALVALFASTDVLARRVRGASIPIALLVVGTGLAVDAGLTGSVTIAQLGGALCAGLGATMVLALVRPRLSLAGPGIGMWSILHVGLVLWAHFYSEMPATDALLIGLAPLALWIAELPAVRRRPAWQVVLARVVLVGIPVGIAVGRAALAFESDPYADGYPDY